MTNDNKPQRGEENDGGAKAALQAFVIFTCTIAGVFTTFGWVLHMLVMGSHR